MIRVCHVQVLPLLSGVQRSMLEIFRHLDTHVFEPHVVCQAEGPLTEELARREIRFHLVPELGRAIRPWRDMRAYRALRRLFKQQQFHVVHNQSAKPRALASLAARHAGVPVVVNHVRGYPFHNETPLLKKLIYRRIESLVSRYCDLTLFVNYEDRERAIIRGLAPQDRCRTVYNGADLEALSPDGKEEIREQFRSQHGWEWDEVVIAVLGRLDAQKQPLILPKIAAELDRRQLDRPWRIVIAGDGSQRTCLEAAIDRAQLWHRFQLIGWQRHPADVLQAADVVALPSLWEGLPRVLIEAHATGVPCVASDISGNREALSRETGILVSPKDVLGYADALGELIENPLLRRQLGITARRRAERLFDSTRNSREIVRQYHALLGLRHAVPVPGRRVA